MTLPSLISTGLQPGVPAGEEPSRFNGLAPVSGLKPLKRFHLLSLSTTRLKPGANERQIELHAAPATFRAESPSCDSLGWSERSERSPRWEGMETLEGCKPGTTFFSKLTPNCDALTALAILPSHNSWGFTPGCHSAGFQPLEMLRLSSGK